MFDLPTTIITDIMTASSNCSLYSQSHEAVLQFVEKALHRMEDQYDDGEISFTMLGNQLLFNDKPITTHTLHINAFMKKMRRNRIEKIILKKGLVAEEMTNLIADLSIPGRTPSSSQHIAVGAIEVKIKSDFETDVKANVQEGISRVREIYHGLSKLGNLDLIGLEDVVINFIGTLKQESNILRIISPVKTYSDYTFAHTTNVTILSIFQAESLGMQGEILHDIGLAGLLHDVGKMFIPKEILDKDTKLTSEEWEIMKLHTVYGAMYLSTIQDVPKLAVISAFEHHMRFNGTGYPDTKRRGKTQHIVSQIVAISDFFDALHTERPYRKTVELPVIISLLLEASGKDFNPVLVDNFIKTFKAIGIL